MESEPRVYSFPTRPRCPRCRSLNNERYSTKGPSQYRRCLNSICRNRFKVIGAEV